MNSLPLMLMGHNLVDLSSINSHIRYDIRYATTHNFTHQKHYTSARAFLCFEAAQALNKAQEEFEKLGFSLLIWDAYRPLSVQKKLWAVVPDERYVMPPHKGSLHNRGCAVDCTLIKNNGDPVLMPTDFDDFSEKAHRTYMNLPQEALAHRKLLEDIMTKHGFTGIEWEWWHFDFNGWENFPLLDITFEEL
jgi:zinc D-Ala-D-Ala dipeptidase